MKIGVLCSPDMMPDSAAKNPYRVEGQKQIEKLVPALSRLGVELERVDWRRSVHRAKEFDAMLPIFAWDYWDAPEQFVDTLFSISENCRVFNSPSTIAWNFDKIYLQHLQEQNVCIVPTQFPESVTESEIEKAFEEFETDRLVIKPRVGGGGFGQSILRRNEAIDENCLPSGPAILQPFLERVQSEGEITTMWFGSEFSHALRKVPQEGEFRVQSHFGGREEPFTASANHIETAQATLAALPEPPLYARIDLLTGNDGMVHVIEAELIEPYFFLNMSPSDEEGNRAANLFAAKLVECL